MYLRTISTLPVHYVENNFTLAELDSDVSVEMMKRLIDSKEESSTIIIKDYDTSTAINLEV